MKNKRVVFLLSIIIFIIGWEISASLVHNSVLLPSLQIIFIEMKAIIFSSDFYINVVNTFIRIFITFLISLSGAIILGIISVTFNFMYTFFQPYMNFMKYTPIMAMIVLVLIWFPKEVASSIIGILMSFPIFYDSIINSIRKIDSNKIELINLFKIDKVSVILKIYLPSVIFSLLNILSSTFGLIIKTVIAGEIYSQPKYGIGSQILYEKLSLNTVGIIAWILIIIVISYIFDLIFSLINKNLLFWRADNDI